MKILIAEDQAPAALFLRKTLERMGHEATVVADGQLAWEAVRDQPVPLLISDWVMPRMDGLQLCRNVRARAATGDCPYTYVILLTSKDSRQDKLDGLRAGADDFLVKPLDADELAVRLEIASRILQVHYDLETRNVQLAELATIDELTGVKNRRRFREDLDMQFAIASRQSSPLSLVMLDVDHFKRYNDDFGHPAGDDILRVVARTIRENTRDQDVVARYGGEEFVVLLPSTGVEASKVLAERLRSRIEGLPWSHRGVTASLGIATTTGAAPILSARDLVEAADQALYRSKRMGRNRITHDQTLHEVAPPAAPDVDPTLILNA